MSFMKCYKCEKKGVIKTQSQVMCKTHFLSYFEDKVRKTIRKNKLFVRGDKICVATSGGKDSLAVLYNSMLYCKKYGIEFFALAIDEGIANYRDHTLEDLTVFCKKYDIPMKVVSFKEKMGATLDEVTEKAIKEHNKKPCSVCGIFRRTLLNKTARELGATKLATGHNLDDEAQTFLMNLYTGNMRHNAALGPITGLSSNKHFVGRVKPLYNVTEKETRMYAFLKEFQVHFNECPNITLSLRAAVRDKLNEMETTLPQIKYGIVNAFNEILPLLKTHYKSAKKFSYCKQCGEPTSGAGICNTCKLEAELCLTTQEAK